jgi:diguanylate cyclase (GGDEF)-like protein
MRTRDIRKELFERLSADEWSPVTAIDDITSLYEDDPSVYSELVAALINVTLEPQDARVILHRILLHYETLNSRRRQPFDLRTAAMDYALRHPELVPEPVVVDSDALQLAQRLAAVDELTGLFNRRFLEIYLQKEMNRARRYNQVFSVVFIDLDDFKHVNDTYGHDVGDEVLLMLGTTTQKLLRKEDFAARYGGEEFVILLPHTDSDGAVQFADRLRRRVSSARVRDTIHVTLSAGVATFPEDGSEAAVLLRNADDALYRAKMGGKDRVLVHAPDMREAPRLATHMSAVCYSDEDELGTVKLCDISTKGLSVAGRTVASPGQRLRFRIVPEDDGVDSDASYEVCAQIIWSRKLDDVEYRLGGRWDSTDEDLVTSLMRQASGQ